MFTTLLEIQATPDWTSIVSAAAGVVGTGGAIKLYQAITKARQTKRKEKSADGLAFRKNLQDRVIELEEKIDYLTSKIEDMIKSNTEEVISLNVQIAQLEAENKILRSKVGK